MAKNYVTVDKFKDIIERQHNVIKAENKDIRMHINLIWFAIVLLSMFVISIAAKLMFVAYTLLIMLQ